jgi:hypothetical protein
MKQAIDIISHICSQPSLKKLKIASAHRRLLELFPPRVAQHVSFMYNRNDTLYFVADHPMVKQEFDNDYKKSMIKGWLNLLMKVDSEIELINAEKFKFIIKTPPPVPEIAPKKTQSYRERSYGRFENLASNDELRKSFEQIRELIKAQK